MGNLGEQKTAPAFANLVDALNKSPMAQRAKRITKGDEGYWSRIIERAARSFENYVIYKMEEKGYNNDFLANVDPLEKFAEARIDTPIC